ncbi:HvfC family RiPP maturation protein [Stenotrophomonas indicatrix]|uniref:HvfC family RiPP maturation protein n=1 Tax=Stenotrophomonas indicatrix TaxID=2045451 RepID=UPI00066C8083|nr:putative DNA-binding domain-containing protein [Stenotrophomonas indicatrix]
MAESLATLQRRWADHVRNPSMPAPDGIEAWRLAIYRRLCIDSLDSLLASTLPRLQAQLGVARWRAAVEHYYARHACHTPLFPQIAGEFAAWLAGQEEIALPGWATELAHYECTQQALYLEARQAGRPLQHEPSGNDMLAVSPLVRVLGYQWPVREDTMLDQALTAAPTLVLLRRRADSSLQVEELAPLAYALLTAFGEDGARVDDALQALADAQGVVTAGLRPVCMPLLGELCTAGALVVPCDS